MALRDHLKLLVVDDMSTSRGLITQALEDFGIQQVEIAESGAQAMESLARSPVHLVLSDYNMPGMDGLALLEAVRHDAKTQSTGFIMITGRATKELVERGRALGLNNYLAKPFTPLDLRHCIEAVVGRL